MIIPHRTAPPYYHDYYYATTTFSSVLSTELQLLLYTASGGVSGTNRLSANKRRPTDRRYHDGTLFLLAATLVLTLRCTPIGIDVMWEIRTRVYLVHEMGPA